MATGFCSMKTVPFQCNFMAIAWVEEGEHTTGICSAEIGAIPSEFGAIVRDQRNKHATGKHSMGLVLFLLKIGATAPNLNFKELKDNFKGKYNWKI